jgi:hypothetical protein
MKSLRSFFNEHPREVGMSYLRHLVYALSVTRRLLVCVLACFVHAFFPFFFTHKTSSVVQELGDELGHRVIYRRAG